MRPLPATPEVVAAFIAECAGRLKVGSVQRRLNAIAEAHKAMGLESPTHNATVRNTMKGIRRTKGVAPAQKTAALTADIRTMVDATEGGTIGARDRALILLGFAGAFRRSELVGLDVEDCAFGKDGLTVTLRRSKTDQAGAGRKIGIPYGSNPETCPVRTMQAWIGTSGTIGRAVVPLDQSAWASTAGPVVRDRRGARGEETGTTRGTGRGEVCGAFAAGRARHQRRDCRSFGALDYESDRAQKRSDGTALYQGRESVPREQRGQIGIVTAARGNRRGRV